MVSNVWRMYAGYVRVKCKKARPMSVMMSFFRYLAKRSGAFQRQAPLCGLEMQ